MRTVRFNVQMHSDGLEMLQGLELKANAHEMIVYGRAFPARALLFRSHSVLSRQDELVVVEMVLQELDETFPAHKRASQPVADLHLLLRDMTVPNVPVPVKDEGQAEVLEDDVADEQTPNIELLGMDANFGDGTVEIDPNSEVPGTIEDKDDGPERDSAGSEHHGPSDDTATVREAGRSGFYPRRDGD